MHFAVFCRLNLCCADGPVLPREAQAQTLPELTSLDRTYPGRESMPSQGSASIGVASGNINTGPVAGGLRSFSSYSPVRAPQNRGGPNHHSQHKDGARFAYYEDHYPEDHGDWHPEASYQEGYCEFPTQTRRSHQDIGGDHRPENHQTHRTQSSHHYTPPPRGSRNPFPADSAPPSPVGEAPHRSSHWNPFRTESDPLREPPRPYQRRRAGTSDYTKNWVAETSSPSPLWHARGRVAPNLLHSLHGSSLNAHRSVLDDTKSNSSGSSSTSSYWGPASSSSSYATSHSR